MAVQDMFDKGVYRGHLTTVLNLMRAHPGLRDDPEFGGRFGGYVFVAPLHTPGDSLLWEPVGDFDPQKEDRCRGNAYRKVQGACLAENYFPLGLSYLCRNEEAGFWGGAVFGNDLAHSISAMPQDGDEVAMVATAVRAGDLTGRQAHYLLERRACIESLTLRGGRTLSIAPNKYAFVLRDLLK